MPTSKIPGPGPGHNAWMMTCAALVLFMTLPGLALFYGGLVRRKNVLSVLAQCLGIAGLVTILWWLCGYSLAFSQGRRHQGRPRQPRLDVPARAWTPRPTPTTRAWVSQNVFSMYQLMFAIITPALIIGAIAERMKFSAILLFVTLWMFVVYFPLAHMVWGIDGMMNGVWNPRRQDQGHRLRRRHGRAHVLRLVGADPLPDPGQAPRLRQRADAAAQHGALHGRHRHAVGRLVRLQRRQRRRRRRHRRQRVHDHHPGHRGRLLHLGHGGIHLPRQAERPRLLLRRGGRPGRDHAGLRLRDHHRRGHHRRRGGPDSLPGLLEAEVGCGYDDALDTFGVHAVGGTLGAFLTGFLASAKANPNLANNLADVGGKLDAANPATQNGLAKLVADGGLWVEQLKAIGITLCLAIVGTTIIAYLVKAILGLRVAPEVEVSGLDLAEHGEEGYHTAGQL